MSERPLKRVRKFAGAQASPRPSVSLETFTANVHYLFIIQEDDEIFDEATKKFFSPRVDESLNGQHITLAVFREQVVQVRTGISNRRLVSESIIAVPKDNSSLSGTVAYVGTYSGIQNGKDVIVKTVSVLQVFYNEQLGRRQVLAESLLFKVEEQDDG